MKQPKLNKKDLIRIVSKYNVGRFEKAESVKTSGNLSFLISTFGGKYFLRLCGEGNRWRSKKEIEGELNLIDQLKASNFPVIEYETMKNGNRVVSIKNHNGYLRKFFRGKQIKGNPIKAQLFKTGKALGRYHQIVKNYRAGNLRKNIDFGVEETIKYFNQEKSNIVKSNFEYKNKFVKVFKDKITQIKLAKNLTKGMIYEDLGKRHVLWRGDKILAIIDFDRSYFGYLILDLGQALRGWCFLNNWQTWSKNNYKWFLRGYQSERRLSSQEKKYLLPAIKFAILERALSFCARYIYSKEPIKNRREVCFR